MFLASLYSLHCSLCGFLKVVAGPGAGKSRVLSSRLAHLLISKRCEPHQILVLSFNHYAAKSLRVKAEKMLANTMNSLNTVKATVSSSEVYCDSFHGFCSVVLKNHGHLLNLGNDLNIADEYEQLKIMTSLLRSRGYKSSNAAMATNLLRRIRFWKESGLGYLGIQREILESWTEKRAYEIYPAYQNELRSRSALDFGDLLLFTLRLFRENPQTLEIYRDKYSHILVDEFQDISPAQYDILRILVVGFLDNTTPFSSSHGRTYVRSETQFNALNGEQLRRSEEYETLAEPLIFHRVTNKKNITSRVTSLMNEVGLPQSSIHKYPHEFSGGQRQRIAVGRAIGIKPEFIIADEPVSALDVTIQSQILDLIVGLVERYSITMVFISHDLSVVRSVTDRVAVMKSGKILENEKTEILWRKPKNQYTQNLLRSIPIPDPRKERARLLSRTEQD